MEHLSLDGSRFCRFMRAHDVSERPPQFEQHQGTSPDLGIGRVAEMSAVVEVVEKSKEATTRDDLGIVRGRSDLRVLESLRERTSDTREDGVADCWIQSWTGRDKQGRLRGRRR